MRFITLFTICFIFQACVRHKITYDIPANYPEARRKQIIELFYKGKELFKANCSECHGVFTKGREKVPNFTKEQIDNYSTRFIGSDAKNHAVARQMSPEQLNQVILFLRYKKYYRSDTMKKSKPVK